MFEKVTNWLLGSKQTNNIDPDAAQLLMAAGANISPAGLSRLYSVTDSGIYSSISTDNRFKLYQQLMSMSPHVAIPMQKLSLTITKKMTFDGDKVLTKEFTDWSKNVKFKNTCQNLTKLLVRDGTYIAAIIDPQDPKKMTFEPFVMEYTSILPKGYNPGGSVSSDEIMTGKPEKVYLYESNSTKRQEFKIEDVIYSTFCPYDVVQQDVYGRDTYGMYGFSMFDPIADLVFKYMDLIQGYTEYIKKYGIGRYHINYKLLEQLILDGNIADAKELLKDLKDEHQYLKENEDIIGIGFDVKQLDTGGSNINVVQFKESLETDIQIGLLQQPLTMGRAEGTTYASGYVSEADRLIVLEGLQDTIVTEINCIVDKRLIAMGKEPGSVYVEVEEVSKPDILFRDLLDIYVNGCVTMGEFRLRCGFTEQKPIETQESILNVPTVTKERVKSKKKTEVVEMNEEGDVTKVNTE